MGKDNIFTLNTGRKLNAHKTLRRPLLKVKFTSCVQRGGVVKARFSWMCDEPSKGFPLPSFLGEIDNGSVLLSKTFVIFPK